MLEAHEEDHQLDPNEAHQLLAAAMSHWSPRRGLKPLNFGLVAPAAELVLAHHSALAKAGPNHHSDLVVAGVAAQVEEVVAHHTSQGQGKVAKPRIAHQVATNQALDEDCHQRASCPHPVAAALQTPQLKCSKMMSMKPQPPTVAN